ncbi:hypothetical protein ACFVYP_06930 [Kitasatospora sp. NPDC058201]|uniref:hypothetical protein n=1 Tax=unclassified Kitasatospora TaxID=2633591 RepID=UPI003655C335
MPTATMSQDGTYRIDLRITRRVSIGDLASYLAGAHRHIDMDRLASIGNGLSAKQVRDTVRTEMERRGTDYIDGWADNFGFDETAERLALATAQIRRAYPELAKAENSRRPPLEPLVTKMCKHGNTPREDVTGDPITECTAKDVDGRTEWGAFGDDGVDDGAFFVDDCAVEAANGAAAENAELERDADDPYATWGRICPSHEAQRANHCRRCNADDAPACTDCDGSGCHWCHWTGHKDG